MRKIIQCVVCGRRYSVEDILSQQYFADTLVCCNCYGQMLVSKVCCFGKQYNSDAEECDRFCPDRSICARFVKGILPAQREAAIPFRRGSIIYRCFQLCLQSEGVSRFELERFVRRRKGNVNRIYNCFRKKGIYGARWAWFETESSVRIELLF